MFRAGVKSKENKCEEVKMNFGFLVADTQLHKRLCPSIGPSVCPSVCWSVCWSVTHESKSGKMSVLDAFMGMCVGGWMPLPTRLQRYCDPASLVTLQLAPL